MATEGTYKVEIQSNIVNDYATVQRAMLTASNAIRRIVSKLDDQEQKNFWFKKIHDTVVIKNAAAVDYNELVLDNSIL